MIIERTCYLPKPGRFDEVLANRRCASRVRIEAGLRAGTITLGDTERGRMVFWEARFATAAEREADLATRAATPISRRSVPGCASSSIARSCAMTAISRPARCAIYRSTARRSRPRS